MARTVITGSASGIGAAIRERLAAEGDQVVGIDLREAEIEADLSTPEGRAGALRDVGKHCGDAIDRLVLCAGVATSTQPRSLIPSVNYFGAVALLDGLLPALRAGRDPVAIAIASNSARLVPLDETPYVRALLADDEAEARRLADEDGHGFVSYGGSKLALCIAIRRRALAFGEAGVRLNAVAPGPVETPLYAKDAADPLVSRGIKSLRIPLGRNARPEEIASLVAFLAGPEAAYVHGAVWYADGGIDASMRPESF